MVASISARKSAGTALGYYRHMGEDDYYARDGEAPVTDLALWADGRPIAPTELTAAAGAVTVRAPGYRPAKVTLPPAGDTGGG